MSEIFMLDSNLGILYGIGEDKLQHLEDHYASIARSDPRNHGGLRAPFHSPSLASRSVPNPVTLVASFRWNAALYDAPPAPIPGKRGRKQMKGKRRLSLKQRLADPSTVWQSLPVKWYNGAIRKVLSFSGTSLWYMLGKLPSLSGGSWCETPRASSKIPLCSAPT